MESNLLKMGNRVYALTEIQCDEFNFERELIEFHHTTVENETQQMRTALVEQSLEDLDHQITHVTERRRTQEVIVPNSWHGKTLGVYQNTLIKVRPLIYSPRYIICHRRSLDGYRSAEHLRSIPMINSFLQANTNNNQKIRITIESPVKKPIGIGYMERTNQLVTMDGIRTFHTFNGGSMCTGRNSAGDYWNLADDAFSDTINTVNTFSLASSYFEISENERYTIPDLLGLNTIKAITIEGEGSGWQR